MFLRTELYETVKLSLKLEHTEECAEFINGGGLGGMTEQTSEAIHREFLKFWNEYKINIIEDPSCSIL